MRILSDRVAASLYEAFLRIDREHAVTVRTDDDPDYEQDERPNVSPDDNHADYVLVEDVWTDEVQTDYVVLVEEDATAAGDPKNSIVFTINTFLRTCVRNFTRAKVR